MIAILNNFLEADAANFYHPGSYHQHERFVRRHAVPPHSRYTVEPSSSTTYLPGDVRYITYNPRPACYLYNNSVDSELLRYNHKEPETLVRQDKFVYNPISIPKMTIHRDFNNYYVQILCEHAKQKDISIDYLKIENELKISIVQSNGNFTSRLPFPSEVDFENISAQYNDKGVVVQIPKLFLSKVFTIDIPQFYQSFCGVCDSDPQKSENNGNEYANGNSEHHVIQENGNANQNGGIYHNSNNGITNSQNGKQNGSVNHAAPQPTRVPKRIPVAVTPDYVSEDDDISIDESYSEVQCEEKIAQPASHTAFRTVTAEDVEDEQGSLSI